MPTSTRVGQNADALIEMINLHSEATCLAQLGRLVIQYMQLSNYKMLARPCAVCCTEYRWAPQRCNRGPQCAVPYSPRVAALSLSALRLLTQVLQGQRVPGRWPRFQFSDCQTKPSEIIIITSTCSWKPWETTAFPVSARLRKFLRLRCHKRSLHPPTQRSTHERITPSTSVTMHVGRGLAPKLCFHLERLKPRC